MDGNDREQIGEANDELRDATLLGFANEQVRCTNSIPCGLDPACTSMSGL